MTQQVEAMKLARDELYRVKKICLQEVGIGLCNEVVLAAIDQAIEQAQKQEPVAMKFEIYKPTVPDPTRQDINNALLPWVYDQDRSSGFDASMWVIPVATLPPQRQPLTDEQIGDIAALFYAKWRGHEGFARAIEAAHGITASEAEDSAKGEA